MLVTNCDLTPCKSFVDGGLMTSGVSDLLVASEIYMICCKFASKNPWKFLNREGMFVRSCRSTERVQSSSSLQFSESSVQAAKVAERQRSRISPRVLLMSSM
jgi:hypothetical protein